MKTFSGWLKGLIAIGAAAMFLGGYVLAGTVLDKPAGDTKTACCGHCKIAK